MLLLGCSHGRLELYHHLGVVHLVPCRIKREETHKSRREAGSTAKFTSESPASQTVSPHIDPFCLTFVVVLLRGFAWCWLCLSWQFLVGFRPKVEDEVLLLQGIKPGAPGHLRRRGGSGGQRSDSAAVRKRPWSTEEGGEGGRLGVIEGREGCFAASYIYL